MASENQELSILSHNSGFKDCRETHFYDWSSAINNISGGLFRYLSKQWAIFSLKKWLMNFLVRSNRYSIKLFKNQTKNIHLVNVYIRICIHMSICVDWHIYSDFIFPFCTWINRFITADRWDTDFWSLSYKVESHFDWQE